MLQKMRRYVKAFSKEEEKEGLEKTDTTKGYSSESPKLRRKNSTRSHAGWQVIRDSAIGLEMQPLELGEDQCIKYV